VHYWWLVKADIRRPMIYGAIVAVLLGFRLVRKVRSVRVKARPGLKGPASTPA